MVDGLGVGDVGNVVMNDRKRLSQDGLVVVAITLKKNTKEIDMPAKLFDEIAPKYVSRNGGYTRIVKIGQRKGDAAMEVLIELV